jgi:hypothetical protein
MDFLEKDLEEILFTSDAERIVARGLHLFNHDLLYRQVPLGNYGIADLISIRRDEYSYRIVVYELKNKVVDAAAFWQTVRYMRGVWHFLQLAGISNKFCVYGVSIGREISLDGNLCYLPFIGSDIMLFTYNYGLEGMRFNKYTGAHLTNPGAVNPKTFGKSSMRDFFKLLASIPKPSEYDPRHPKS